MIEIAILSSLFDQYLSGGSLVFRDSGSSSHQAAKNSDAVAGYLAETVLAIRSMGRKVVLVAPPPSTMDIDYGRCVELRLIGRNAIGADSQDCAMSAERYRVVRGPTISLLEKVSKQVDVDVLNFDSFLCEGEFCRVEVGGYMIYRDNQHLSYEGSRYLGLATDLSGTIEALAR